MGRDRAPTEGAIRKLVRKVREKGMLVDDRSGPRARTVRTPENIEAVAQILYMFTARRSHTEASRKPTERSAAVTHRQHSRAHAHPFGGFPSATRHVANTPRSRSTANGLVVLVPSHTL
ncbi:hypothetical protein G5I_01175 [Acromyrmex echinatior]|uniref:DUF4817 domain-containing protein n=1 Tax=Acromyrmex echinatior TaxID=103372 RepID=F4W6W9_ACREC|nr:hypothetical protein G5I_01175 [Acromyrmex echinatior]